MVTVTLATSLLIALSLNLQATKLFFAKSATKREGGYHPHRFTVWFKISYRVIQHIFMSKMAYLDAKLLYIGLYDSKSKL